MTYSQIYRFDNFDEFHRMANGSLQARHDDVQVFEFSEIGKGAVKKTPLFKTNFYQIGLFKEVQFEVSHFDTHQVVNQKNAVVLFKPGQTCSFSKTDPNASGYAIMFKESFIDWRMNNSNTIRDFSILNPAFECVLFLEQSVFDDLTEIASKMWLEYKNPQQPHAISILRLYAQLLIEKLNRISSKQTRLTTGSLQYQTSQQFKSLVYKNIHSTKTVRDYATMLSMTEKTLINHFRQTTDLTPKEFINTVIVEESKAMLLNKASVEQVSNYFNFTDQAHFSNFFRHKTGRNPTDARKQ